MHYINSVSFSPEGSRIVTGSEDNMAIIWDVKFRTQKPLIGHTGGINSVSFSPDGMKILTGSSDKLAIIWDA